MVSACLLIDEKHNNFTDRHISLYFHGFLSFFFFFFLHNLSWVDFFSTFFQLKNLVEGNNNSVTYLWRMKLTLTLRTFVFKNFWKLRFYKAQMFLEFSEIDNFVKLKENVRNF